MCTQRGNTQIKQVLVGIKGEIDGDTDRVGDFDTPLTSKNTSSRQKINKETVALNATLDHRDLIYIFRTFHSRAAEYTFFSSAHGTFFRIDHMLGHKISLNKFKIETVSSNFSNHNDMKQTSVTRKKNMKNTQTYGD